MELSFLDRWLDARADARINLGDDADTGCVDEEFVDRPPGDDLGVAGDHRHTGMVGRLLHGF